MELILKILKLRLGISTDSRDEYLTFLLESIIQELETMQGIKIDIANKVHQSFVVDYAEFRYDSKDEGASLPRHLEWRLHNLFVKEGI